MMGSIYKRTRVVVAQLGPEEDNSTEAEIESCEFGSPSIICIWKDQIHRFYQSHILDQKLSSTCFQTTSNGQGLDPTGISALLARYVPLWQSNLQFLRILHGLALAKEPFGIRKTGFSRLAIVKEILDMNLSKPITSFALRGGLDDVMRTERPY